MGNCTREPERTGIIVNVVRGPRTWADVISWGIVTFPKAYKISNM